MAENTAQEAEEKGARRGEREIRNEGRGHRRDEMAGKQKYSVCQSRLLVLGCRAHRRTCLHDFKDKE